MSGTYNKLVQRIRGNSLERREAIRKLVADTVLRLSILNYVKANNGSETEALTVYDDAIVTFIKIVHTRPDMKLTKGVEGYIMGVAKNLWNNERRKRGRAKTSDIEQAPVQIDADDTPIELILRGDRAAVLRGVLDQIQIKCKEVLMYWSSGYKMKEIAHLLDYKSDAVVRKKKSECMKQLLQYLAAHPHIKEQLSNI